MATATIIKIASLPCLMALCIATLLLALGRPLPKTWRKVLAWGGSVAFLARWVALCAEDGFSSWGMDFDLFWGAGRAFLSGEDPYSKSVEAFLGQPLVYPPNTPPVMSVFAVMSKAPSFWVFQAANLALALALGPLAWKVLRGEAPAAADRENGITPYDTVIIGLLVAFSPAVTLALDLGHIAFLISGCLLGALLARNAGRPILAGLLLGVAAVKPTMAVPFLMLFPPRRDFRVWATSGLFVLLCLALMGSPAKLAEQFRAISDTVARFSAPGQTNDYSFANDTRSETMLGFDHLFYRLGIRDESVLRWMNISAVVLVGAFLATIIVLKRLDRPACYCLAAIFSLLFFYHRVYDGGVLILPMLLAAGSLPVRGKYSKVWYLITLLACLVFLYTPGQLMKVMLPRSLEMGGWRGWAIQATLLSLPMWSLLIALVGVLRAEFLAKAAESDTEGSA